MGNGAVKVRPAQFVEVFKQFSPARQWAIERKLWAITMDNIVTKIRENAKKNRITEKEVSEICDQARQELYDNRRNRH